MHVDLEEWIVPHMYMTGNYEPPPTELMQGGADDQRSGAPAPMPAP